MEDKDLEVYNMPDQYHSAPSGQENEGKQEVNAGEGGDPRAQRDETPDNEQNSPKGASGSEAEEERQRMQAHLELKEQNEKRKTLQSRERAVKSGGTDQYSFQGSRVSRPSKKADVRSSMQTNTTAYTLNKAKIVSIGGRDDHSLRLSQGSWQKGKYAKSKGSARLNEAYSFSGETPRRSSRIKGIFKYSEHNLRGPALTSRKLGPYYSIQGLYQRSTDSSRYRSPRNNMLDAKNGPGEHNLAQILGFKKAVSTMPNSPFHAFAKQETGRKPCEKNDPYPGTFTYNPEKIKVLSQTPRPKFTKSPRFQESMIFKKNFSNMPHSYLETLNKKPTHNKMGVMGKDERFRSHTHISPGPGQYSPDVISSLSNVSQKTMNNKLNQTFHGGFGTSKGGDEISRSLSKKASRKSMPGGNDNEGHLFGTHYNRLHYFPEIDKDFKNREGPGPAKYELFSRVVHSPGIQSSFPKVEISQPQGSRQIELRNKKDEPAPNSYKHERYAQRVLSNYPQSTRVHFGTAQKNFDIRNCKVFSDDRWSIELVAMEQRTHDVIV